MLGDFFAREEGRSLVRKTFQMEDKELRASINFHLFQCILVLLAPWAVPFVVAWQSFLLTEPSQAVLYGCGGAPSRLNLSFILLRISKIDLLKIWVVQGAQISDSVLCPLYCDLKISVMLHGFHDFFQSYWVIELIERAVLTLMAFATEIACYLSWSKHSMIHWQVVSNLNCIQRRFLAAFKIVLEFLFNDLFLRVFLCCNFASGNEWAEMLKYLNFKISNSLSFVHNKETTLPNCLNSTHYIILAALLWHANFKQEKVVTWVIRECSPFIREYRIALSFVLKPSLNKFLAF